MDDSLPPIEQKPAAPSAPETTKVEIPVLGSTSVDKFVIEGEATRVTFRNGRTYEAIGVPEREVREVATAKSAGSAFHAILKSRYAWTEVF